MIAGKTPEERLAAHSAEAKGTILRMTTDPAAPVAIVAKKKLEEHGEAFGPEHGTLVGQIHQMALDAAIRHADFDVEEIHARREQGGQLAALGMTGEQFDAFAPEVVTFEQRAFEEI